MTFEECNFKLPGCRDLLENNESSANSMEQKNMVNQNDSLITPAKTGDIYVPVKLVGNRQVLFDSRWKLPSTAWNKSIANLPKKDLLTYLGYSPSKKDNLYKYIAIFIVCQQTKSTQNSMKSEAEYELEREKNEHEHYMEQLKKIASKKNTPKNLCEFGKELEQIVNGDQIKEQEPENEWDKELEQIRQEAEKKLQKMRERMKIEDDEYEQETLRNEQLFEEKLRRQNKEHQQKLDELRKKREQIRIEAELEFQKTLKNLEMQKSVFLKCVHMKLQFEEKEQEWADFIETVKSTLGRPRRQCEMFRDALRTEGSSDYPDKKWLEHEHAQFHSTTLAAHRVFYDVFFYLYNISETVPDKIFIRILMKSIAKVSNQLFAMLEKLDNMKGNFGEDIDFFHDIHCQNIPSTWKLRELSKTANFEDYKNIDPPFRYISFN